MADINDVTQEQLNALEAEVTELKKFKDDSEPKLQEYEGKKSEWEKKEQEFKEQANPNWQKARQSMDAMKAALKDKGVEVDDDGNVKSNPQNLNVDQIRQEAVQAARNELLGGRLEELLGEYDNASAQVVKHYYNKLTAGESVTLQNIKSFVTQAENAARSNPDTTITRAAQYGGGAGPRTAPTSDTPLDDKTAQDLGSSMGLSFANPKKK